MELNNLLPPVFGVFGLVAAAYTYAQGKKYPEGEGKVVEIGNQIHLGAMVFMKASAGRLFVRVVVFRKVSSEKYLLGACLLKSSFSGL